MPEGTVEWFDNTNGYGFITSEDGDNFFVYYNDIIGNGHKTLTESESVRFDIRRGPKGPKAVNVVKISSKKTMGKGREKKIDIRKKSVKKSGKKIAGPGIKKQYLKSGPLCNITFILPKAAAPNAQTVTIVGDFNNWNSEETKMKKLNNGDFKVTLKLQRDREYRFKYLINGSRWENDWHADKYVPNQYGSDDSLVIV